MGLKLLIVVVCVTIVVCGVLLPLGKLIAPTILKIFRSLLEKSPTEKQKKFLQEAQERVRIAEIQQETMRVEKRAIQIQNSILEEEFENIDEEIQKSNRRS